MAEPNKQQIGDGSDSYGAAVQNAAKAAKQAANVGKEAGKTAATTAAAKGAEATANAAAATVKAGVEGGKAVAEIAADPRLHLFVCGFLNRDDSRASRYPYKPSFRT